MLTYKSNQTCAFQILREYFDDQHILQIKNIKSKIKNKEEFAMEVLTKRKF